MAGIHLRLRVDLRVLERFRVGPIEEPTLPAMNHDGHSPLQIMHDRSYREEHRWWSSGTDKVTSSIVPVGENRIRPCGICIVFTEAGYLTARMTYCGSTLPRWCQTKRYLAERVCSQNVQNGSKKGDSLQIPSLRLLNLAPSVATVGTDDLPGSMTKTGTCVALLIPGVRFFILLRLDGKGIPVLWEQADRFDLQRHVTSLCQGLKSFRHS